MPRYFLELSYKGTRYKGFQIQKNSHTVQGEMEKALKTILRQSIALTGSSRTDTGVHALQNFFHFDSLDLLDAKQVLYKLNAVLPHDIAALNLYSVLPEAHSRFDAVSRRYNYHICTQKNPFLYDRAYHYPYKLEEDLLHQASEIIKKHIDFTSFSKRKTQVKTFHCTILESGWEKTETGYIYNVCANRFLRGMVRGLVGTMLKAGRRTISLEEFETVIENKNNAKADFSTPPQGLFLMAVNYPGNYFDCSL